MKYTVITGASSGIGYATALAYARQGSNLVINARREKELNDLRDAILEINPQLDVRIIVRDLSITQNVYDFYEMMKDLEISTFINNAGFGNFELIGEQNLAKIEAMLHLNIEALTILSSLFVRDYQNIEGTTLINVASTGGYRIVSGAVTYCATKFYVAAFTEGLAQELQANGSKLKAKVLAPAATETEFAARALNDVDTYDYTVLRKYHTAKEMAKFVIQLHESDKIVGIVDSSTYQFNLLNPQMPHTNLSATMDKK